MLDKTDVATSTRAF